MRTKLKIQIEELQDRHWIYPLAGTVVVETIAARTYPQINMDSLADCLADNLFDWQAAIEDYLSIQDDTP